MKKVVAFNGGPRKSGNSVIMLNQFLKGIETKLAEITLIDVNEINLKNCQGCLRCNIIGRCSLQDDDWEQISQRILEADVLVFASPVYFHHLPAPLKKMIDRFRSFVKVQITETGLIHTPHVEWKKEFVLLLSMGSSNDNEAKPIVDLFDFMTSILGKENRLHSILATRLAVSNQIQMSVEELEQLYPKLKLGSHLAEDDFNKNQYILNKIQTLGEKRLGN